MDVVPALNGFVSTSRRLNVYRAVESVAANIDIMTTIPDLVYNGTLNTFNSVSLSADTFWRNKSVHVVINKHSSSRVSDISRKKG